MCQNVWCIYGLFYGLDKCFNICPNPKHSLNYIENRFKSPKPFQTRTHGPAGCFDNPAGCSNIIRLDVPMIRLDDQRWSGRTIIPGIHNGSLRTSGHPTVYFTENIEPPKVRFSFRGKHCLLTLKDPRYKRKDFIKQEKGGGQEKKAFNTKRKKHSKN